jgi:pyridoxine kinase
VPELAFPVRPGGAGDLFAALFLAHSLKGGDAAMALALAASSCWGVLRRTYDAEAHELLLIEAQNELVAPDEMFAAERVA